MRGKACRHQGEIRDVPLPAEAEPSPGRECELGEASRISLEEAEVRGRRLTTEIHGHLRLGISEVAASIRSGRKSRGLVHTKVAWELARGFLMRGEQAEPCSEWPQRSLLKVEQHPHSHFCSSRGAGSAQDILKAVGTRKKAMPRCCGSLTM